MVYGVFGLSVIAGGEAYHGVLGAFGDVSAYGVGAVARAYERGYGEVDDGWLAEALGAFDDVFDAAE